MWIVKLALRRPYTFVVMALLILGLGGLSMVSMSTDIFPPINIPVVTVLWQYAGLTPDDMATRIATYSEYVTSSTVDNIRSIESQTLSGISVIKVFLPAWGERRWGDCAARVDLADRPAVHASRHATALYPAL